MRRQSDIDDEFGRGIRRRRTAVSFVVLGMLLVVLVSAALVFALILLSSLLAACVTAFAGPISFVGIAVPHLVKRLLATSKPIVVIPAAFLGGAIFCLFCDLLARALFAPTEVSISAVTAIFGAPIVIGILLRRQKARS